MPVMAAVVTDCALKIGKYTGTGWKCEMHTGVQLSINPKRAILRIFTFSICSSKNPDRKVLKTSALHKELGATEDC